MAYARKRDGSLTGQWVGEHTDRKASRRFRRYFDTKKEAEAYEAYVRMMGVEPPTFAADGTKLPEAGRSFREIAERCKAAGGPRGAWARGKDKHVLTRLEYAVTRLGDYAIDDITRALVRDKLVADLLKRPRAGSAPTRLKQGTVNRYVTAVSAVLTWAVHEDILKAKPQLEFKAEHDRTERAVVDFELEDRITAWLKTNGYHAHALCVRWLADTGMRLGELYQLRPEQIANDHVALSKEQTKTHRPRLVYVPPSLAREMRALIASGGLPDRTHLLRTFQRAAELGGTESHVVLHGLRHTRNTRLRRAGVSEKLRMEMLGHTSAAVNRGYDHVDLEDQRKAAELVEQMRGDRRGEVVILSDHSLTKAS